eukprot:354896-Prorocentrum_minimum.AAC.1
MPLVFFVFSRVLRRAWCLHLTDTSPSRPPICMRVMNLPPPSTPPLPLSPDRDVVFALALRWVVE